MRPEEIESESEANSDKKWKVRAKTVKKEEYTCPKMGQQSKNGKERAVYMPENGVAEQKR